MGMVLTPQMFFDLLWRSKPDGHYIQTWALQNKQSFYCLQPSKAARSAETYARASYDAYCCVALSPRDYGPHARCPAAEASAIAGLWSDRDMASPLRSSAKKLPATIEEADRILADVFPPTLTINSGYGLQDWWLFKEVWVFDTAEERERASKMIYEWQTIMQFRAARNDWSYDRLADMARLLRIPGTFNFKNPQDPRPVEALEYHPERLYNPSEIRDHIDEVFQAAKAEEPAAAEKTTRTKGARQPSTKGRPPLSVLPPSLTQLPADDPVFSITVNPDAEVPKTDLELWLSQDDRFARTWRHDRPDLADQTLSGYSMALANFAADIGLPAQQICDLIVHWRRKEGQRISKHPTFFRLTIAKAMHRDLQFNEAPAEEAPTEEEPATTPPPPEPGSVREALGQRKKPKTDDRPRFPLHPPDPVGLLSAAMGFEIKRIVKVDGESPRYRIETAAKEIRIPSARALIDQNTFRAAVCSQINYLVPKFKTRDWDDLVRIMLEALENPPGDPESDFKEAAITTGREYLFHTAFRPDRAEPEDQEDEDASRQPMIIEGHVAINSRHFLNYLKAHGDRSATIQDAIAMLDAASERHIEFKTPGHRSQRRWLLPLAQFPPEKYKRSGGQKGKTNGHAAPDPPATQ